jgi:hypothetical protein
MIYLFVTVFAYVQESSDRFAFFSLEKQRQVRPTSFSLLGPYRIQSPIKRHSDGDIDTGSEERCGVLQPVAVGSVAATNGTATGAGGGFAV